MQVTNAANGDALLGEAAGPGNGLVGRNASTDPRHAGHGVVAASTLGVGVWASSTEREGVVGVSSNADGVFATSSNWHGVYGSTFQGIVPDLTAGRCDMIMSGLYINADRLQVADAVPYMTTGHVIMVPAGNPAGIAALEDLCGKTVAIQGGGLVEERINELNTQCTSDGSPITIQAYPDVASELQQIVLGRVDAIWETDSAVSYWMVQNPDQYEVRSGLVEDFLKAFYSTRWAGAPEMENVVLPGGHEEGAVVNVRIEGQLHAYSWVPLLSPAYAGTQMFVNHPQVSAYMRHETAALLCEQSDLVAISRDDEPTLTACIEEHASHQMSLTLGHLGAEPVDIVVQVLVGVGGVQRRVGRRLLPGVVQREVALRRPRGGVRRGVALFHGDASGVGPGAVEGAHAQRVGADAVGVVLDVDDVEVESVVLVDELVGGARVGAGIEGGVVELPVVGPVDHHRGAVGQVVVHHLHELGVGVDPFAQGIRIDLQHRAILPRRRSPSRRGASKRCNRRRRNAT